MGGRGGASGLASSKTSIVQRLESIDGTRWTKYGKDRMYFGEKAIGLETDAYRSGSIRSATLNGEEISNRQASRIGADLSKIYYDLNENRLVGSKGTIARELLEERIRKLKIKGGR